MKFALILCVTLFAASLSAKSVPDENSNDVQDANKDENTNKDYTMEYSDSGETEQEQEEDDVADNEEDALDLGDGDIDADDDSYNYEDDEDTDDFDEDYYDDDDDEDDDEDDSYLEDDDTETDDVDVTDNEDDDEDAYDPDEDNEEEDDEYNDDESSDSEDQNEDEIDDTDDKDETYDDKEDDEDEDVTDDDDDTDYAFSGDEDEKDTDNDKETSDDNGKEWWQKSNDLLKEPSMETTVLKAVDPLVETFGKVFGMMNKLGYKNIKLEQLFTREKIQDFVMKKMRHNFKVHKKIMGTKELRDEVGNYYQEVARASQVLKSGMGLIQQVLMKESAPNIMEKLKDLMGGMKQMQHHNHHHHHGNHHHHHHHKGPEWKKVYFEKLNKYMSKHIKDFDKWSEDKKWYLMGLKMFLKHHYKDGTDNGKNITNIKDYKEDFLKAAVHYSKEEGEHVDLKDLGQWYDTISGASWIPHLFKECSKSKKLYGHQYAVGNRRVSMEHKIDTMKKIMKMATEAGISKEDLHGRGLHVCMCF